MNKIKTIALDLGGVFFSEGKKVASEVLYQKYGYDKEMILDLLNSPKSKDLRKGLITDEEFWLWATSKLPQGYDVKIIKKEWYDGYILDENILNLVKKLKNKYKIIAFSGNIKSKVEYLDKKYHFRRYFDAEIYSYDHCFDKKEKKSFEILTKETGNKYEEILLIDDDEKHIGLAKELGMNAVIYQTGKIEKLEEALRSLGFLRN